MKIAYKKGLWLSTPHGKLGTGMSALGLFPLVMLSTPHGKLGTMRASPPP